jgi:hypothetical protein
MMLAARLAWARRLGASGVTLSAGIAELEQRHHCRVSANNMMTLSRHS